MVEHSLPLIREAIRRELGRGGQVYYVHNRIEDIDKVRNMIEELVPEARVASAHGRMTELVLERVMMDFMEGETDVLVCTTIVESGLDITNANTVIIDQADRLGLAQLYQIRGRVGRSNRVAYAYLTYNRDKILSEVAEKTAVGHPGVYGAGGGAIRLPCGIWKSAGQAVFWEPSSMVRSQPSALICIVGCWMRQWKKRSGS